MLIKLKSGDEEREAAAYAAGATAAAETAWMEINRPLTALAINRPISEQLQNPTASGAVLELPFISLPIGMEVKSITCTAADVDAGWMVLNLTLGTMNLVNPQGAFGGVNLSSFHALMTHEDKIAPWVLSKTKVDVQVAGNLLNGVYRYGGVRDLPSSSIVVKHTATRPSKSPSSSSSKTKSCTAARCNRVPEVVAPVVRRAGRGVEAIFHGFNINAFQEEQVCAIQTRIEPTDRLVGCAELINIFRQTIAQQFQRDTVRHVQSRDPVQTKVARVAAAAGNLYDSVKSLIGGGAAPAPQAAPFTPGVTGPFSTTFRMPYGYAQ